MEDHLNSDIFKNDSIYLVDIDYRIKYLAKLNKEIIPAYQKLKIKIDFEILIDDFEKIMQLHIEYQNGLKRIQDEMDRNQRVYYYNTLTYSRINNLLIFEGLLSFPDSYAILLNDSYPNSIASPEIRDKMNDLYNTYNPIFTKYSNEIELLQLELKKVKSEFKIPEFLQSTGNQNIEDSKLCKLIDLLLWAIP